MKKHVIEVKRITLRISVVLFLTAPFCLISCTDNGGLTGQSQPGDRFNNMTPAEHLAAAKASLVQPQIAKKHLDAIPQGTPEFKEIEEVKRLIEAAEKEKKRVAEENRIKVKARQDAAIAKLAKKTDKFEGITWYYDKTTPKSNNANNMNLYFGKKDGHCWLRYQICYAGEDWLFIDSYKVMIDGQSYDIVPNKVERDNYSTVWEWCDENVTPSEFELFKKIASAKDVKLRYIGNQYRHDRTVTQKEKTAIKNVLIAFEGMGGTVE